MSPELLSKLKTFLATTALDFSIDLIASILILFIGWRIAAWLSRAARRAMDRSERVDATLKPLATSLVRYAVMIVTLLAVLARFGVQTTSVVAVLGAAGLAIGLALQGTLSNVAAGVMLLVLRPFKVGDAITTGSHSGSVLQIGLFTTELNTADNVFVSLPNSSVWNSAIINYSRNPTRRINMTVGISYSDDIDRAIAIVNEVLEDDARVLAEPAPMVAVRALGESSVDLVVQAFTATADFWATSFALNKTIKQRFDAEGVSIPFPQRDLHFPEGAPLQSVS